MGTETSKSDLEILLSLTTGVKLNNPPMGTETSTNA